MLATNRHVTCGGPDLRDVSWKEGVLSGVSELVPGDPYVLYLNEPAGSRFDRVDATGARVVSQVVSGSLRIIRLESAEGGVVRVEGAVPCGRELRARAIVTGWSWSSPASAARGRAGSG